MQRVGSAAGAGERMASSGVPAGFICLARAVTVFVGSDDKAYLEYRIDLSEDEFEVTDLTDVIPWSKVSEEKPSNGW